MTQPTFSDGPLVPLMVEGAIDAPTLTRLFADLESAASVIGVREKGAPTAYSGAESLTTGTAVSRMLSGAARAVQVRYRFSGHEWVDTILALPGGFRVVRCRFDATD
ncbi:MAG: hypothetical protein U0804_06090 [Gemmataceae bacterium]